MESKPRALDEALAPFKKKIEQYEKEIEKRKQAPRQKDEYGLAASAISGAMRHLSAALQITPEQMIEAHKFVSKLSTQSMQDTIAEDFKRAQMIAPWLRQFLQLAREFK